MNRKDFITKMLELGSQLELSCSGIEANMIINDAEKLHDKYIEQKQATKQLETEASDICHSISDSGFKVGEIVKSIDSRSDCYGCINFEEDINCDNKCMAPAGFHYR